MRERGVAMEHAKRGERATIAGKPVERVTITVTTPEIVTITPVRRRRVSSSFLKQLELVGTPESELKAIRGLTSDGAPGGVRRGTATRGEKPSS